MNNIFDIPFAELQRFQRGDPLTADKLNQTIDAENSRRGVTLPKQHRRLGGGGGVAATSSGVGVRQFELFGPHQDGDTLRGWMLPRTTDDQLISIARPLWLMQSVYDGLTIGGIKYTYPAGEAGRRRLIEGVDAAGDVVGETETQVVARPYQAGEFLWVAPIGTVFIPFRDDPPWTLTDLSSTFDDVNWMDNGNGRLFVQDVWKAE